MLKLVILDPHPVVLRGIKAYFKKNNSIQVIGAFEDINDFFSFIKENPIDLVIMEMELQNGSAIKTIQKLKRLYPKIMVMIFTSQSQSKYQIDLIKAGASGYLSKKVEKSILIEAIKCVTIKGYHLTTNFELEINKNINPDYKKSFKKNISKREIEVLKFLMIGKRNNQIAESLGLSQKTTNTYKNRLMKKLCVNNEIDLYQQVLNLQII